jgi:hypothetical protein
MSRYNWKSARFQAGEPTILVNNGKYKHVRPECIHPYRALGLRLRAKQVFILSYMPKKIICNNNNKDIINSNNDIDVEYSIQFFIFTR